MIYSLDGLARNGRRAGANCGSTGGVVVGVRTSDAVVLAADTRTTRGGVVASDAVCKLDPIRPAAAIGSADDLGDIQSFVRTLRTEADRYADHHGRPISVPALATVAGRTLQSFPALDTTFLLGGVDEIDSHVFTIDPDGAVVDDHYAVAGTGRRVAYGVLEDGYDPSLSLGAARDLVADAIDATVERDPRTGPRVDLAEITDEQVAVHRFDSIDAVRP